ncbi:hypothetical protein H257_00656 [Aphanomyces astaci]|uniref:Tc3 transposase DNA binding domain-containing protein n=1 Tax=Aphanomyces astaci TaxID=112090 RepID=W4HCL8_APHAT|nr:hypothetical protein H257_00656 [Aphanomyces astaci]ETV89331.1 hypothetical protein H257_00656 [Aphanomyces astaci]|eukprot:XP_009821731.1 hypothetical protein H257_00656 [Aphanomyces astaci]
MPKGYALTLAQRGSIVAFCKAKLTIRRIADELEQSSSSGIKHDLHLTFSTRTVRRILFKAPHNKYTKRKANPRITLVHKKARVEKFNLDGPDDLQYYWHDVRKDEQKFLSRQNGGDGVMIWDRFSSQGRTAVAVLQGRQDSYAYCDTVANYVLPFVHAHHPDGLGKTARTVDSAKTVLVAYFQALKVDPNPARDVESKQYVVVYELSLLVNSLASSHMFVGALYRFLLCASYIGCFRISEMLNLTWDGVAVQHDGDSQYVSLRLR